MVSSEIRKEARTCLKGKWGKGAFIIFVYMLVIMGLEIIASFIPVIGGVAVAVVSVPIAYGITVSFMKLKRGEEVSCVDFLADGFGAFGKVWAVTGNILLKLLIPLIIVIVCLLLSGVGVTMSLKSNILSQQAQSIQIGGIIGIVGVIGYIVALVYMAIKSLYYVLSMYILRDNPTLTGKEIVEKSEQYMRGNRWNYVWLNLTFIGWSILAGFTFGIGALWLIPYIQVAQVVFYEDKAGSLNTSEKADVGVSKEN